MSLHLIRRPNQKPKPNERIVAHLERLLVLAKAGELHDLATVHYEPDEFLQWSETDEALLMGALLYDTGHTLITTREGVLE